MPFWAAYLSFARIQSKSAFRGRTLNYTNASSCLLVRTMSVMYNLESKQISPEHMKSKQRLVDGFAKTFSSKTIHVGKHAPTQKNNVLRRDIRGCQQSIPIRYAIRDQSINTRRRPINHGAVRFKCPRSTEQTQSRYIVKPIHNP